VEIRFQPNKVFGETKLQAQTLMDKRHWALNDVPLKQVTAEKNVGVLLNSQMSSEE
jgi:hypothetical protein